MNEQQWNEALNEIDEDLVENYVQQKEAYIRKKDRRKIWRRAIATAACLCLIVGAVFLAGQNDNSDPYIPTISGDSHSHITLRELFGTFNGISSYKTIYVADGDDLNLSQIPEEETVELYKRSLARKLDRKGFESTLYSVATKLEYYLNMEMPELEIKESKDKGEDEDCKLLETGTQSERYCFEVRQNLAQEWYWIYARSSAEGASICLDNEIVQIDQTLSDEEIVASLESVKKKLFDIFGVSFTDVRIWRYFNGYSEHGASYIYVYFYNAADTLPNAYSWDPTSDYICLKFPNGSYNSEGSDGVILAKSITYKKSRYDYESVKSLRKITLEEAEELLREGFCFGMSCPLCMAQQKEVDFEDYDYVGFSYVIGVEGKVKNMGFPFYVFYKLIGTAQNGNLIYAQTCVPAIEVKELAKYFPELKQTSYYSK